MRRSFSFGVAFAVVSAVAIGAANDTWARGIRIDQGNNFDSLGTALVVSPIATTPLTIDLSTPVDLSGLSQPPALPSATSGFQINYGEGLVSDITIYADGYISFDAPVAPGVDGSNALVSGVAAPFYLSAAVTPISMSYSQGIVDLSSPFDTSDAVQTLRATWTIAGVNPADNFQFQVVLYDMSGLPGGAVGDFDMEFNYGFDADFDPAAPVGSTIAAGFHLGANAFDLPLTAATFSAANDYTFAFRNGALVSSSTPPTSVSEPGTLALIGAGLIVIAWGAIRRHRRRTD